MPFVSTNLKHVAMFIFDGSLQMGPDSVDKINYWHIHASDTAINTVISDYVPHIYFVSTRII